MSTRSFRTLIEYAASRGSKATSRAGARRYLLANQPPPIAGLRRLTTGDASPSIGVTVADSIQAGNCRAGTDAFRKQHPALTRTGSIRADLLLALVASGEARAAVAVAHQRATHVPQ